MARLKTWRESVGPRGATVAVGERRWGGNVRLGAQDPRIKGTRWRSLGFRVRDAEGELIPDRVERARAEAARLSNLLIAGEEPEAPKAPPPEPTVSELLAQFERDVVPGLRGKHRQETERQLELLRRTLGTKTAIDIDGSVWLWLQRSLMSGEIDARGRPVPKEKRRPVGPRTAAKLLKTLRFVCTHAFTVKRNGRRLIPSDPTAKLKLPRNPDPAQPICDDRTLEKVMEAAGSHTMRVRGGAYVPSPMPVLLTIARDQGRRIGAIVALRWEDWRPDIGTYGKLTWRADADKLGRTTITSVTPDVRTTLETYRLETAGIGQGWVFPAPKGQGHVSANVAGRWLRACEKAARLPHEQGFGWHALRRAFATRRKGMSLKDTAGLGGWKGTQVLVDLYQKASQDGMEQVLLDGQKVRLRATR